MNRISEEKVYDVVVAGGGPSGSMAAIAASRAGMSVLLIEQYAFLGGSLTAMGVGPMMTFHNNVGEQVVRGYPQELIERLIAKGGSPGHVDDVTTYIAKVTPFDSEMLKIELEDMVFESGGEILYHTTLVDVEISEGQITAVVVANKAGLMRIRGKIFIDSSGDGDLASRSGIPFKQGRDEDGMTQPMTMNLKVGNVDRDALIQYVKENPEDCLFEYGSERGIKLLESAPRLSLKTFINALKKARKEGEISFFREYVLMFETGDQGTFIINVSRIQGLDGTDPYDLSRAESIGRKQCAEIFQFLRKRCRGFENAIRMDSSAQVGVRETRRIEGEYTVTAKDLVDGRQFEDTVCLSGYPIDIHAPQGQGTNTIFFRKGTIYGIPFRSMINRKVPNLIINGRCLSATHEALAGIRTTPVMMGLGQGAGIAASIAAKRGIAVTEIPFPELKEALKQSGALVEPLKDFFMFTEDFGKDEPLDDPNKSILD